MAFFAKSPYIMLSETDPDGSGSVSGFRCNSGMLQIDFRATDYNLS